MSIVSDSDLLRGERILASYALTDGKLRNELSGLGHVGTRNELGSLLPYRGGRGFHQVAKHMVPEGQNQSSLETSDHR